MSKPVILTGLRANNELHIGNYFGGLLPIVDMAKKRSEDYQINLFVPDLHSFTTPIDHTQLQAAIMQNLRVFAAAGLPLDHDDVFIYRQSYIPAHSELTWILDCFTGFGELFRMTQFKEKGRNIVRNEVSRGLKGYLEKTQLLDQVASIKPNEYVGPEATVGLFNYPVLMAADILLYGAEYVPVGDDQTQHLEFTRDIAGRLNGKFGELFVVPKPVKQQHEFFGKDQGLRIRDLQNPAKKMSKSDTSTNGIIFLTDTPEAARKKIISAETDSLGEIQHDYDRRPGVSNLLDILKLLGGDPTAFIGQPQYGPLKMSVADKVDAFLVAFQAKLATVDEGLIRRKLASGEASMNGIANATLLKVQKAVGLR